MSAIASAVIVCALLVMSFPWLLTDADSHVYGPPGDHADVRQTSPATDDSRRHELLQHVDNLASPSPPWVALPVWQRQLRPTVAWSRRDVSSAKDRHHRKVLQCSLIFYFFIGDFFCLSTLYIQATLHSVLKL